MIDAQRALVPVDAIMMLSGTIGSISEGWALCDGNNETPDLFGRFIVGYNSGDYDTIGNTDDAAGVTLSTAQLPAHNHSDNVSIPPHTYNLPGSVPSAGGASSNQLSNSNNIGHTNIHQTSLGEPLLQGLPLIIRKWGYSRKQAAILHIGLHHRGHRKGLLF